MTARIVRVSSVAALGAVLLTAGAANAATKRPVKKPVRKTQVVQYAYSDSESVHPVGQPCVYAQASGEPPAPCWSVDPPGWARFMSITSSDATGRATPISMFAQTTGVNTNGSETFICGSAHDLAFPRGSAWTMSVDLISVDASCPGPATTGAITVTFSNLP